VSRSINAQKKGEKGTRGSTGKPRLSKGGRKVVFHKKEKKGGERITCSGSKGEFVPTIRCMAAGKGKKRAEERKPKG